MDKLDDIDFSQDQKWILHLRCVEKMTYRQIQACWAIAFQNDPDNLTLSPSAIKTCFKRSALGLNWSKGKWYGNAPYLSKPDEELLKDYIAEQCAYDQPADVYDVLAEAHLIRKERQLKAIQFLIEINCKNLAEELENTDLNEPVRSWVNEHLENFDAKIRAARVVDFDRFVSCTRDVLLPYLELVYSLINSSHPTLIFGGDESSLEPRLKKKCVIPSNVKEFMMRNNIGLPHFSVMFCNNCIGKSPPLFIMIPDLDKSPLEVQPFIESGLFWACSTASGWETRNSFLYWVLNFINWLSEYRLSLNQELREQKAVLILDGHNSRENPFALKALKQNNIEVVILPAHTTHLLQMFDVVLAKPFKKSFTKIFTRIFERECLNGDDQTLASIIRSCVFEALSKAWSQTCNVANCMEAARKTGTVPANAEIILQSPFVHELSQEEKLLQSKKRKTRRLNINARNLTDPDVMDEINTAISQKMEFKHLCYDGDIDYLSLCSTFRELNFDDVRLFSPIYHYSSSDKAPAFFK